MTPASLPRSPRSNQLAALANSSPSAPPELPSTPPPASLFPPSYDADQDHDLADDEPLPRYSASGRAPSSPSSSIASSSSSRSREEDLQAWNDSLRALAAREITTRRARRAQMDLEADAARRASPSFPSLPFHPSADD